MSLAPMNVLMSKCGFATLLIPLGGRTTYVVGLGALSDLGRGVNHPPWGRPAPMAEGADRPVLHARLPDAFWYRRER
jgi:hypothetical protein